ALTEREGGSVRKWPREQTLDAGDSRGAEGNRTVRARTADRAAGTRRVADERAIGVAALGTARQVRQVPGEPEQLQLKRERDRVQRRTRCARRQLVDDVEEARQRLEPARIPLLFGEQPEHRLRAEEADAEPVLVFTRAPV